MEAKKGFPCIWMFLLGIIIGALVVYLLCCRCNVCCNDSCGKNDSTQGQGQGQFQGKAEGIELISVDTANAYFNCYLKTPKSIDTLLAFNVSMEQLTAMQLLKDNDTAVKGFRIYMGVFGDPIPVNMVVGTDLEGDDKTESIYKTSYKDPCPDLCDVDSDIVTPPEK